MSSQQLVSVGCLTGSIIMALSLNPDQLKSVSEDAMYSFLQIDGGIINCFFPGSGNCGVIDLHEVHTYVVWLDIAGFM